MHDDDSSGMITAGFLIAAEQQRQADQAAWEAQTQARELAHQADELNHQLQQQAERTLDIESDYYRLFNLLKAPMHVIAERNAYFAQTYAQAQREIAMLKMSELAFRELAIELGSKLGMSAQSVVSKSAKMRLDVLRNGFSKEHGTNADTSPLLKQHGPAILASIEAEQKAFRDKYKELINGKLFQVIEAEVEDWNQFHHQTAQLANAGNIKARYNLGFCYLYGYGVARNFDIAEKWLLKAHHAELTAATYLLHFVHSNTDNPKYDASTAEQYLQLAEHRGDKRVAARRPEWDAKRKQEEWNREEPALLQALLTIRPGQRPPELDRIKGRGYVWEDLATMLHACSYRFAKGETENLGSLFKPKKNTRCFIEVTNPTDYSATVWFELEHDRDKHGYRPLEWKGSNGDIKPHAKTRVDIGKFHVGTSGTGIAIRSQQKEKFASIARLEHICSGLKFGTLRFELVTEAPYTV